MIDDVIDAGHEEPIDRRPDVGERRPEMFAEPGRGLGGYEPMTGDVSG